MATDLSDKELVKAVRGSTSKRKFAELLGVSRSVIPQYEQGLVRPHTNVWIKMARLVGGALKLSCWERAGLTLEERSLLLEALRIENEPRSERFGDFLMAKEAFSHSYPEPVTECQLVDPTPEKDKAKTLDDLVKRYGPLEQPDWEGAKERAYALLDEVARDYGIPPAKQEALVRMYGLPFPKPVGGEAKPLAAAKKAKPERRRKK